MKLYLAIVFSLVMPVSTAVLAQGPDPRAADDETAIHNVVAGLVEAWNEGDARAWSAFFTGGVDFTEWTGKYWKGRDNVLRLHEELFKKDYKDTKLKLYVRRIRFLREDMVLAHAEGSIVKQDERFPERPQYSPLLILTKQGDDWSITVFQNLLFLEAAKARICEGGS